MNACSSSSDFRSGLLRSYRQHFNPALALHFELAGCSVEASARGAYVFDETGTRFLDVGTAHGVFGVGHCEPAIRGAVLRQLAIATRLPATLEHEPGIALRTRLAALLPDDLNQVFVSGSGSEAVEVALRTALLARPGRSKLISASHGYHGKTLGALTVMGMGHLRAPFEPVWRNVARVPFGDAEAMAAAIDEDVAAVVIEPVMGGGTVVVPPPSYLRAVRAMCDEHRAMLIADEVQTGLGRTGKMFGIDHAGVVPDAIVLSKTLTGGHVPLATTVVRESVMDDIKNRIAHAPQYIAASTQWPVVAAAGVATLDFVVANDLPRRAAFLGGYLLSGLESLAETFPDMIVGAPGIGLMTGIRVRNRVIEHALWMQLRRRGVIAGLSLNSSASNPVLRIYPLSVTTEKCRSVTIQNCRSRPALKPG